MQQPDKTSAAFRKKFLDGFQRTNLDTTPGDAMMLRILVESSGAKRGVEIGVCKGFGAINMGIGFERTGGHLYSIEVDPQAAEESTRNLEKVGLEKTVTVITGDALKTVPGLDPDIDFVFIDARKSDYLAYLKALEPKLKPGAVVVGDNVVKHESDMRDFLDHIQTSPDYDTVIIRASTEKGDGMSISYKVR